MNKSVSGKSKILVADDDETLCYVLKEQLLEKNFEVDVAYNSNMVFESFRRNSYDIIFLDLNMPGMVGFNGLVALRNAAPSVPIVVVSASEDATTVTEAITYGASGFLPKSLAKDDMAAAVKLVLDGEIFTPRTAAAGAGSPLGTGDVALADSISQLTHQQRVVLQMLVNGRPNKQIAYELSIVESTVKAHVSAILRKLRVHSHTQAVVKASKILSLLGDLGQTRFS